MNKKPGQLAVLIDMDPERPHLLGSILAEAASCGTIGVRRAYGNHEKMSPWGACLRYRGIESVCNYGEGGNAADATLIIDAVDLFHTGRADGFCIVAEDHIYTGLVKWLCREGAFVAGIGRQDASPDLRQAYGGRFTAVEDLPRQAESPDGPCREAELAMINSIRDAINDSRKSSEEYVRLSVVRDCLGAFEPRDYCHSNLVSLVKSYGEFDVREGRSIGLSAGDYVRIRPPLA